MLLIIQIYVNVEILLFVHVEVVVQLVVVQDGECAPAQDFDDVCRVVVGGADPTLLPSAIFDRVVKERVQIEVRNSEDKHYYDLWHLNLTILINYFIASCPALMTP